MAQWESNPTPYGRVLVLNSFDAFGWNPGPNLMTRLPVTFESNKGRCSDEHQVNGLAICGPKNGI